MGNNTIDSHRHTKTNKRHVAILSVIAAIFLTLFKLIVGILTGSLGILSEALHSALDFVAAAITCGAVHYSDKPADRDHNYGHGKIENLSALIETFLLLITCVWIIYEAIHRLCTGDTEIEVTVWSYIVVITSIVIDFGRSRSLSKAAKEHNSQALEADALHFSTDIWSSSVVLLGLICSEFGYYWGDSVAALGVAIIVIWISYRLGMRAIDALIDKVPKGSINDIERAIRSVEGVLSYHNLKVRSSGADTLVEVNIHVDRELNISEAHSISYNVEKSVRNRVKQAMVHVHIEPDKHQAEH